MSKKHEIVFSATLGGGGRVKIDVTDLDGFMNARPEDVCAVSRDDELFQCFRKNLHDFRIEWVDGVSFEE